MSPGEAAWRMAYEISPIYLTGGLAGSTAGATVPLITYLQPSLSIAGLDALSTDDFFAHFIPLPGSTLLSNAIGLYPFANQSVAGNALIAEPLTVSLLMICPAQHQGDYRMRQAVLTSLKRTLESHNLAGGTYSVATPSYLYTDCVFLRMTDASSGETRQAQYRYQLDFSKPLISQQEAQMSYNNLMAKLNAQTQVSAGAANWSGVPNTVGNDASGAAPYDTGLGFASDPRLEQGFGNTQPGTTSVPSGNIEQLDNNSSASVDVPSFLS